MTVLCNGGLVGEYRTAELLRMRLVSTMVDTLLTGGAGFVLGSLLGVLELGKIQTIITFEGTLSSWWTRIVVLQRVLALRRR